MFCDAFVSRIAQYKFRLPSFFLLLKVFFSSYSNVSLRLNSHVNSFSKDNIPYLSQNPQNDRVYSLTNQGIQQNVFESQIPLWARAPKQQHYELFI